MSTQFDYLQLFPGKPPPPQKKTMLILCLYFQKLFCNTNNYEHVSKCSSRDTVRKFNPSTSSLCLQYSNDDIYSSAQMFVYILTFHVNKPIFLSLVNKISGQIHTWKFYRRAAVGGLPHIATLSTRACQAYHD